MKYSLPKFQQVRLNKLAKKVLENNQYLSLATTDSTGHPWISPVCYTIGKDGVLYFASPVNSRHGRNIAKQSTAAWSIFDSRQKWGKGVGLQVEGVVSKLSLNNSKPAGYLYIKRKYPYGGLLLSTVKAFIKNYLTGAKTYRFYKLTPERIWINNPYEKTDERVEVDLKTISLS